MAYTIADLKNDIGLRIHDPSLVEVSTGNMLLFINMAVRDAQNAGWLKPLSDDTSLTEAVGTYDFTLPAGFVYVYEVLRENVATQTWDYVFPINYWDLRLTSGTAKLHFDEFEYLADSGAKLMIRGQGRPTIYALDADVVDNLFESFLRERATFYAASFVAGGLSQYAQYRQRVADTAYAVSEQMLSRSPQEFRMKPNSKKVPGA